MKNKEEIKTLSQLKVGQKAIVKKLNINDKTWLFYELVSRNI
jgi:hypothetical protein